jgi:hypothetical protein
VIAVAVRVSVARDAEDHGRVGGAGVFEGGEGREAHRGRVGPRARCRRAVAELIATIAKLNERVGGLLAIAQRKQRTKTTP